MIIFSGETFAEVYRDSLSSLFFEPEYQSDPRGLPIKENLGVSLVISDPRSCLYKNPRRSSQFKYIAGEFLWYFLGRNDVEFISQFSKFWKNIQNPDGTANSAYGNLIFSTKNEDGYSQYKWAIESLKKDVNSRQSIMHFNMPKHQYPENKDFVCTMYGIFHIRENKLHFRVKMRSNDAILGTPTDVAFFTTLQQQALSHLREYYPDLQLGTYTHDIDSYHIYERHFGLVRQMLEDKFIPVSLPELKEDFINKYDCSPSFHLLKLKDYGKAPDDDLYKWIENNLNK